MRIDGYFFVIFYRKTFCGLLFYFISISYKAYTEGAGSLDDDWTVRICGINICYDIRKRMEYANKIEFIFLLISHSCIAHFYDVIFPPFYLVV